MNLYKRKVAFSFEEVQQGSMATVVVALLLSLSMLSGQGGEMNWYCRRYFYNLNCCGGAQCNPIRRRRD